MSDIHALSGAYAVDALDDLDRVRFERHLAACDTCLEEVSSFQETTSLLAELTPATPPASLRANVLAEIATVRPLPPLPVPVATTIAAARRRRFSPLVAAAAVVAIVGLGGAVAVQPWQDEPAKVVSVTDQVLTAADAQRFVVEHEDGSTTTLVRSRALNQAVLVTKGLRPAPDGHAYELWLQHDGVMVPAGLVPRSGDSAVLLSGDAASAEGAGITIEPEGGSAEPSDDVVALFDFEQA